MVTIYLQNGFGRTLIEECRDLDAALRRVESLARCGYELRHMRSDRRL